MNRWEEEQFKKDLWNSVFFSSSTKKDPICWERLRKRRKIEYEQLVIRLKLLEILKEKEMQIEEKKYKHVKPIYSDEDRKYLQDAYENKEISMFDLTANEVFLLNLSYPEYLNIQRMLYSKFKLTRKGWKEYYKNREKLGSEITPRTALKLYKDANTKYPPRKKKK